MRDSSTSKEKFSPFIVLRLIFIGLGRLVFKIQFNDIIIEEFVGMKAVFE